MLENQVSFYYNEVMRTWKKLGMPSKNILEKFMEDYNLTIEEAASATGLKTSRAFKKILEEPDAADGHFIGKFCSLTGYTENELFEFKEDIPGVLIVGKIDSKFDKVTELQKDYLHSKSLDNRIFNYVHKPVISFMGDVFAGKDDILKTYFPQVNQIAVQKMPVYCMHYDDFAKPDNSTIVFDRPFYLTPQGGKLFEPSLAFDPSYIRSCTIKQDETKVPDGKNTVVIVRSDFPLLKNCILLNLPAYDYENSFGELSSETLRLLISYNLYADTIVYFDAVTRLLTISETPVIRYLMSNEKKILIIATKKDLNKELYNKDAYRKKQEDIEGKKGNPNFSYYKAYSYPPKDDADMKKIQETLFFYESEKADTFLSTLDKLCDSFKENILYDNVSFEVEEKNSGVTSQLTSDEFEKLFEEVFREVLETVRTKEYIEYIKKILDSQKQKEQNIDFFLSFIQSYAENIYSELRNELRNKAPILYHLLPEWHLYFGNLLLPLILEKKNFSKGDTKTWAKRMSRKICDAIATESYKDFVNIVQQKIIFNARNYR